MSNNPNRIAAVQFVKKLTEEVNAFSVDFNNVLNLDPDIHPIEDAQANLGALLQRTQEQQKDAPVVRVDYLGKEGDDNEAIYALIASRAHIELPEARAKELAEALQQLGGVATEHLIGDDRVRRIRVSGVATQSSATPRGGAPTTDQRLLRALPHSSRKMLGDTLSGLLPVAPQSYESVRLRMNKDTFSDNLGPLIELAWNLGNRAPIVEIGDGSALLVSSETLWRVIDQVNERDLAFYALSQLCLETAD